jgi:hypothetical protein
MGEYWNTWYARNRARLMKKQRDRRKADPFGVRMRLRKWRMDNPLRLQAEPSRNSLYRKLRRNGVDRNEAAHVAGITLTRKYT